MNGHPVYEHYEQEQSLAFDLKRRYFRLHRDWRQALSIHLLVGLNSKGLYLIRKLLLHQTFGHRILSSLPLVPSCNPISAISGIIGWAGNLPAHVSGQGGGLTLKRIRPSDIDPQSLSAATLWWYLWPLVIGDSFEASNIHVHKHSIDNLLSMKTSNVSGWSMPN